MRNLPLMPEQASKFAEDLDPLFFLLTFLTIVFTGLVVALIVVLGVRYRRGARVDRSRAHDEHLLLEITWSVIPLFLGLGVFVWGAKLFADVFGPAPANAKEVFVVGKQWMWHLQHTNGIRENNMLHVPIGKPVKLTMISQDVIHDFFVPEFRIHMDVVPGRYTSTWFTPTKVGRYHLFCSQYCGTNHSQMTGWVYVMPQADYDSWMASGGEGVRPKTVTMEQRGQALYDQHACGQCHDADGMGRGPSLVGLYGSNVKLRDGRTVPADVPYLRKAILDPSEDIALPYNQVMPSYKGQLTEEQVIDLIGYIKSMGGRSAQPAGGSTASPSNARGNTPQQRTPASAPATGGAAAPQESPADRTTGS